MSEPTVAMNVDVRGVAHVTLQRANKHNAFDEQVIEQLSAAFTELASNDSVRVVVLASDGKNFSAGADLDWMQRMAAYSYEDNIADARKLAGMLQSLHDLPQTTIARIQGAAFGGAVGLVGCCDIAIAADDATFCLSEVRIGLIPATIGPYVIRAMGERAARRYFCSAERFSAAQALQCGLVSEVVQAEGLDVAVEQLVQQLLELAPQAQRQAKQLVADLAGHAITDALIEDTCERIARIRVSTEGQEGLTAFLEKRKPAWLEN